MSNIAWYEVSIFIEYLDFICSEIIRCITYALSNILFCFKRFSYKWKAVIPGSNWYHSHSSYQRGDGLLGMYIVRLPPEQEVHSLHYDFDLTDHYIIAQEWFHGVRDKNFDFFII